MQSIAAASNNLRLSTNKIEVVALLREMIVKSDNLEEDIKKMKKITELSTLAIRLSEILNYLTQGQIDLFKFSEKFKEHSQYLIKDLSHMLDMVSPATFKQALDKLKPQAPEVETQTETIEEKQSDDSISIDLSKRKTEAEFFEKSESDKIKEEIILEEEKEDDDLFFQNYESSILKPIKSVDGLLKKLSKNEVDPEELLEFAGIMKKNGEMSSKIGFDIIANMHRIISKSMMLVRSRELMPGKEVVEAMRACLIVIVAVVRGKEVDITNYLNLAEDFGRKIQTLKVREF